MLCHDTGFVVTYKAQWIVISVASLCVGWPDKWCLGNLIRIGVKVRLLTGVVDMWLS